MIFGWETAYERATGREYDAEKLAAEIKRKAEIGRKMEQVQQQIVDDIWRGLVLKPMRLPDNWRIYQNGCMQALIQ